MKLAEPHQIFPKNNLASIIWFWFCYWLWFFVFLPWMLFRQIFISGHHFFSALFTWNRKLEFLNGNLTILYQNSLLSLIATTLFGERFLCSHYHDVILDPGPVFAQKNIKKYFEILKPGQTSAICITHFHEEHIGNANLAAQILGVPIYGSKITLSYIQNPEPLSDVRKTMVGQPKAADGVTLIEIQQAMQTPQVKLTPIESNGHCQGHVSFYDAKRKILFAGDSFLHEIFTSPNKDVDSHAWLQTLNNYHQLDIQTMIGSHGYISTVDTEIPDLPFVVERKSPQKMIADKIQFIQWAKNLVEQGEALGLPYSVIEACLFPWQSSWAWKNWFNDESFRLFSFGEFSRTHFVRSLSQHPEKVPVRFKTLAKIFGKK